MQRCIIRSVSLLIVKLLGLKCDSRVVQSIGFQHYIAATFESDWSKVISCHYSQGTYLETNLSMLWQAALAEAAWAEMQAEKEKESIGSKIALLHRDVKSAQIEIATCQVTAAKKT